jgi:hypothetical protein
MTYPKNTQARIIIGNIVMGRLRKQAYFIKVILLSNGQDGLCMGGGAQGLSWLVADEANQPEHGGKRSRTLNIA